jgi:hypothetical protein
MDQDRVTPDAAVAAWLAQIIGGMTVEVGHTDARPTGPHGLARARPTNPRRSTMTDLTPLTDSELDALRVEVLTEQERRRMLVEAPAQTEALGDRYAAAVASAAPVAWASVPDAIGPGVAVTWTDGNRWRNKSGAWLPKAATPATYALGWAQETGLPTASPWSATGVYKAGDLVTYSGKTYRCLQAHTANAGWTPTAAVSLWTVA